jgi:hypothetical protein
MIVVVAGGSIVTTTPSPFMMPHNTASEDDSSIPIFGDCYLIVGYKSCGSCDHFLKSFFLFFS